MRALLIALCLPACSPAAPPPDAPRPADRALAADTPALREIRGEWRLTTMNGRPAPVSDADYLHPITMSVGDFSFRAQSQCVPFWRRYERTGNRLVVTGANPGAMCARGLSPWETEFGRTLSAVDRVERSDDALRLTGPEASLTFEPAPALPRQDITGRWRLRAFHGAPPPAGESPIEITITGDRIDAHACVFSHWNYRQDGTLMEVTPARGSVCERTTSPFEQRFGAFMDRVHRATIIQQGALILDSPSEQVEFRRVP